MLNMFSNLTQSVGVPFNSVFIDLGSFAVVERSSFSSSSRLCVACKSASIFSYHIRPSCSSCRKRNSVKRRSSSRCCSCLASSRFLSISSSISSCVLFKNFATFSLSTKKCGTYTWPSCPSSIVSPIEEIHHDLFLIPFLAK